MTNSNIIKTIVTKFEIKGVEVRVLSEIESELSHLTSDEVSKLWTEEIENDLENTSNYKEAKEVAFDFLNVVDFFKANKTP